MTGSGKRKHNLKSKTVDSHKNLDSLHSISAQVAQLSAQGDILSNTSRAARLVSEAFNLDSLHSVSTQVAQLAMKMPDLESILSETARAARLASEAFNLDSLHSVSAQVAQLAMKMPDLESIIAEPAHSKKLFAEISNINLLLSDSSDVFGCNTSDARMTHSKRPSTVSESPFQLATSKLENSYPPPHNVEIQSEEKNLQLVLREQISREFTESLQSIHDELKKARESKNSLSSKAIDLLKQVFVGLIVTWISAQLVKISEAEVSLPPFKIQETPFEQVIPNNEIPSSLRFTNRYEASVYRSKGVKSEITGIVTLGQPLRVISKQKNWSLVEYTSTVDGSIETGWILTRYTTRPSISRSVHSRA